MIAIRPGSYFLAAALAASLWCSPAPARAGEAPHPPRAADPLGLRIQGTLRELFLAETGAEARALERPQLKIRYSISNEWNEPMTLERRGEVAQQGLDEQADVLDVQLRFPWSAVFGPGPAAALPGSARPLWQRLSTSLELRATLHWGGWTDGGIEAWHGLIRAFNFNRGDHARDQIHLLFADAGGTAFDIRGSRLALGDVVLRTQLLLAEGAATASGPRYGLSARLDLKVPTGSLARAGGSGGTDAALALLGTWEATDFLTLHALAAFARFSPLAAPVLLQVKPWHATLELSAVFDVGPVQLLLEDRVETPLLQPGWNRLEAGGDNGLLSSGFFAGFRAHNQISWAVRGGPLSLWLSEDFTPGSNPRSKIPFFYESNAPDVTLGASLTLPL